MKTLFSALVAVFLSFPALAGTCENGALYKSDTSGEIVTIQAVGTGESAFTKGGALQPGMALKVKGRSAIYGPMRSYMFIIDSDAPVLANYKWQKPDEDVGGSFRVLEDAGLAEDGSGTLFSLSYVACAP